MLKLYKCRHRKCQRGQKKEKWLSSGVGIEPVCGVQRTANCLSDYGAAAVLKASCVADMHRRLRERMASRRSLLGSHTSRRSLDGSSSRLHVENPRPWRHSLDRQYSSLRIKVFPDFPWPFLMMLVMTPRDCHLHPRLLFPAPGGCEKGPLIT